MNGLLTLLRLLLVLTAGSAASAQSYDHSNASFTTLLKKHVVVLDGGRSSQVKYAELLKDRGALKAYLDSVASIREAEFEAWNKPQRLAFLVNTYNAATLDLILQNYPVKSIKDIGSVFDNRWKRKFIKLFGREVSLDEIEHEMLRNPGVYNEVRIHYAVNCAAIGCPALREEAFVADRLEAQLEEQAVRFLSDRSRNRFTNGSLETSMIFKWFVEDWERGYTGFDGKTPAIKSPEQYFARYAKLFTDNATDQARIANGKVPINHLNYDWSLNDKK
jgi:hypothetical protein